MAGTGSHLDKFLAANGYDAPDTYRIQTAYDELAYHLHQEITPSVNSHDHDQRPQVICQKIGLLGLNLPARNSTFQIATFGTISPDIYHDIVWERIQNIPSYTSFEAGIYEVQKLPVLRFLIHYKGYNFDWIYHQTSQLVRTFNTRILRAPSTFLANTCDPAAAKLIKTIAKQSALRDELATAPSFIKTFYRARAWASLNGILDEDLELQIANVLGGVSGSEKEVLLHPVLRDFLSKIECERLQLISDEKWLNTLQELQHKPVSAKFGAQITRFLSIKITHAGCSESQASTWFRLIESRLTTLEDSLNAVMRTPIQPQELPTSIKNAPSVVRWLPRLVHRSSPSSTKTTIYEGCYLFGFAISTSAHEALLMDIEATIEKQLAIINRHESTLPGRCFITYAILTKQALASEEAQNGILANCNKLLPRTSISPPAFLLQDSPQTFQQPVSNKNKSKYKSSNRSNQITLQIADSLETVSDIKTKSKLRTSAAIHSRLLYDPLLNIDEYTIGYLDRFSAVPLEMRADNWVRVKEEEGFVPESRVVWFKRRWREGKKAGDGEEGEMMEEIVWDREGRVDKVFWSGVSVKDEHGDAENMKLQDSRHSEDEDVV